MELVIWKNSMSTTFLWFFVVLVIFVRGENDFVWNYLGISVNIRIGYGDPTRIFYKHHEVSNSCYYSRNPYVGFSRLNKVGGSFVFNIRCSFDCQSCEEISIRKEDSEDSYCKNFGLLSDDLIGNDPYIIYKKENLSSVEYVCFSNFEDGHLKLNRREGAPRRWNGGLMFYLGTGCRISNVDIIFYGFDITEMWNNDNNCFRVYYNENLVDPDYPGNQGDTTFYYFRCSGGMDRYSIHYFTDLEKCSDPSYDNIEHANFTVRAGRGSNNLDSINYVSRLWGYDLDEDKNWGYGLCWEIVDSGYSFSPLYPYTYECHDVKMTDDPCHGHGLCLNNGECVCPEYFDDKCTMLDYIFWPLCTLAVFVSLLPCCCCCCICCLPCLCCLCAILPSCSVLICFFLVLFRLVISPKPNLLYRKRIKITPSTTGDAVSSEHHFYDELDENNDDEGGAKIKINQALFEIKYEDISIVRKIGEGGSRSLIFLVKWKNNLDCAFKSFLTKDLFENEHNYGEFEREVEVMSSLRHPYCASMYGCCLYPPRVGIVMEYCAKGDLRNFLLKNPTYPVEERLRILTNISDGMDYLHDRNVIHRDLKCDNVLISEDFSPKIIDFGLSRIVLRMSVHKTSKIGTSYYMAPEIVQGNIYNEKCDVFSFSMIIYETITSNFFPFEGDCFNIEFRIANDENCRPNMEYICSDFLTKYPTVVMCMKRAWRSNADERPSFLEIRDILTEASSCIDIETQEKDTNDDDKIEKEIKE